MSKSKKPAAPAENKGEKAILFVRVAQEIEDAILAFQAAQRVRPEKSAVVTTALVEFLEREGFYKPKKEDSK